MNEYVLTISPNANWDRADGIIEACCAAEGLRVSLRTSLKKFPGSRHWHFKFGDNRGTLEITLWQRRIWCSVRAGRTAPWIELVQPKICQCIQARLATR